MAGYLKGGDFYALRKEEKEEVMKLDQWKTISSADRAAHIRKIAEGYPDNMPRKRLIEQAEEEERKK